MASKLLVIDDQTATCRNIERVARMHGFTVQTVTDSRIAADAFLEFGPDLVILDLIMPGLDGVAVLDALLRSGIPARIVLTTGGGVGDAYTRIADGTARFHGLGPLDVLHKPFTRQELVAVLRPGVRQEAAPALG